MNQDTIIHDSTALILLYSYQYVYRVEADGRASSQLCIDADKYGSKTKFIKLEDGLIHEINSFDEIYITVADTYYLGNCQMWTTNKYYYKLPN